MTPVCLFTELITTFLLVWLAALLATVESIRLFASKESVLPVNKSLALSTSFPAGCSDVGLRLPLSNDMGPFGLAEDAGPLGTASGGWETPPLSNVWLLLLLLPSVSCLSPTQSVASAADNDARKDAGLEPDSAGESDSVLSSTVNCEPLLLQLASSMSMGDSSSLFCCRLSCLTTGITDAVGFLVPPPPLLAELVVMVTDVVVRLLPPGEVSSSSPGSLSGWRWRLARCRAMLVWRLTTEVNHCKSNNPC